MVSKERKEIIQVNGLTILIVMGLMANFLIVGAVYRFHNYQLFVAEKKATVEYKLLLSKEHELKSEIILLEGVPTWNDTQYVKLKR